MYSMLVLTALSGSVNAGIGTGSAYVPNGCYGCYGCYGCANRFGNGQYPAPPLRVITYGCFSSCYGGYYGCANGYYNVYNTGGARGGSYGACHGGNGGAGSAGPRVTFHPHDAAMTPYGAFPPPTPDKVMPPAEGRNRSQRDVEIARTARPARLIVDVPANSELYVDGKRMRSTAARRTFSTPELNPGQTYFYELRAEVKRNGRTESRTQRIEIKAGDEIKTAFSSWKAANVSTASAR